MINTEALARQVLRNCDISDAHHAGLYSICGLALRLRDLYKWDTGTPPWEEKDSAEVLDWIGHKEERWESLTEDDYIPICINGREYPPFDTRQINAALSHAGLFYGAGYGYSLKPTFFLAAIATRQEINGIQVLTLDRELARDLMTLPALTQDGRVLLRTEAARLYLWDQILYVKKSGQRPLGLALNACGISDHRPSNLRYRLEDILAAHQDAFIYHELGEIQDRVFDRTQWRELIADFSHTAVELLARRVKDLLADTCREGALAHIIENKNAASVGFYAAFQDGMARQIFPELPNAYDAFTASGSWEHIALAVDAGHSRARSYAETLLAIYREGKHKNDRQWVADTIENRLLAPLSAKAAA